MVSRRVVTAIRCWYRSATLIVALVFTGGPAFAQAARIDTITPLAAKPGERARLTGIGFGARGVSVVVGGVPAVVTTANGNSVEFVVPPLAPGRVVVRAVNPGGRAGTIDLQILSSVIVNTQASVQTIVGPLGGALQTVDRGIQFTLTIPAAALDANTLITLTPIRSYPGLPFSGGLVAGVRLAPDGLQFNRPARLTFEGVPPTPPDVFGEPHALMGFTIGADGANFEVLPARNNAGAIAVPVSHFSDSGVADASAADFVRRVGPIVAALPANASPQVVAGLVRELAYWIQPAQFGLELCSQGTQPTICETVFNRGLSTLQSALEAALIRMEAHIQAGEPFLAFQDLATVISLLDSLRDISEHAAAATTAGYDFVFDPSDLSEAFDLIIDLAKQQARDNPRLSLLALLVDLGSAAGEFDMTETQTRAFDALANVLDELLRKATVLCATDPPAAEVMMEQVLEGPGADFLDVAEFGSPGLTARFRDARAACPIRVWPESASVAMFETAQLSGTAVGYSPDTLTWRIDGYGGGGAIDASGLFTAANESGTYMVLATSDADPAHFRRVPVVVVPVQVSVTPETATVTAGQTQQFSARVEGPTNTNVTWSTTGGTIDATGLFTAQVAGTFTVTASSVLDSGFFDTATVTVSAAPAPSDFTGTVTLNTTLIDPYAGRAAESMTAAVEVRLTRNVLTLSSASGTYSSNYSIPGYCNPITVRSGSFTGYGIIDSNLSGYPGDFTLQIAGEGTRYGSEFNGKNCITSSPQPDGLYFPEWTGLIGTFVRQNGEVIAIDFNRMYVTSDGTMQVTSGGRLLPKP